ncbi:MAG TPA: hypothetical protein PLK80_05670 [bacterium]|nr:MAG: hypothetical protein BWY28_00621 [bacterium ADurb.Bin236]HOY63080.1 hypothetical protein [bacterium]HPI76204.1 hypothetical protein [bacterium]HPN93750.1 hypothetical protein [bacterium]
MSDSSSKSRKLAILAEKLSQEFTEPLREALLDGVAPKKEFSELLDLVSNTFYDIADGSEDRKKMERRIKKFLLGVFDINYEKEISDDTLRQSVKLIREKIVGKSQKEALAEMLAAELVGSWINMDADALEKITGDGGILERLEEKAYDGPDYTDDELIGAVVELGSAAAAAFCERLSDADMEKILTDALSLARAAESNAKTGDSLLELARFAMNKLGFVALMRRAFAGLLIGDIIMRAVGKQLGLEQDVTVTDFIIVTGAKVFDAEGIKKAKKEQTRRVIEALEASQKA